MGWVIGANRRLGRRQNLNGFRLLPVEAQHVPIANSDQTIAAAELLVEVGERHAGISEGALWRLDASGNSGPPGVELSSPVLNASSTYSPLQRVAEAS